MVRRWFVFVLSSAVLAGSAAAARKPELRYQFNCSAKVDQWVCERQITTLRNIVERQCAPLPAGWVWLVVADSEWPALQRRYHLKHDYAFTQMGERRTVFNSLLFQQFDRPVWEWAIAHESAHVACDLVDDEAAERVARELVSDGFAPVKESCTKFTTDAQRNGGNNSAILCASVSPWSNPLPKKTRDYSADSSNKGIRSRGYVHGRYSDRFR